MSDPVTTSAARQTFCYPGCKHDYCEQYDRAGEGKCWELWHAGVRNGPYCQEDADHEGWHKGGGMVWPLPSGATTDVAARFLAAYRRIPNSFHEIVLRDDGWIEGTLCGFERAVLFNNVGVSLDA